MKKRLMLIFIITFLGIYAAADVHADKVRSEDEKILVEYPRTIEGQRTLSNQADH